MALAWETSDADSSPPASPSPPVLLGALGLPYGLTELLGALGLFCGPVRLGALGDLSGVENAMSKTSVLGPDTVSAGGRAGTSGNNACLSSFICPSVLLGALSGVLGKSVGSMSGPFRVLDSAPPFGEGVALGDADFEILLVLEDDVITCCECDLWREGGRSGSSFLLFLSVVLSACCSPCPACSTMSPPLS